MDCEMGRTTMTVADSLSPVSLIVSQDTARVAERGSRTINVESNEKKRSNNDKLRMFMERVARHVEARGYELATRQLSPVRPEKMIDTAKAADDLLARAKRAVRMAKTVELDALDRQLRAEVRKRRCRLCAKVALLVLSATSVLFYGPLYQHLRAVGRIGLIQLAPYWNWRDYYHTGCLLEAKDEIRESQSSYQPDCSVCEDLVGIDVATNVSSRFLMDHYVGHHIPVIVSDGALAWPSPNNGKFLLRDLIQAYRDDDSGWAVCNWRSNLQLTSRRDAVLMDLFRLVEAEDRHHKSWFAHWENCGRKSVKTGRRFYSRPYFITSAVDLSFNNWILVSAHRYQARRYKPVKLRASLAMVAQIRGSNRLRLLPQMACRQHCDTISFQLLEGEIALLNPKRWNLEYQPGEKNELNVAIVVQGEID